MLLGSSDRAGACCKISDYESFLFGFAPLHANSFEAVRHKHPDVVRPWNTSPPSTPYTHAYMHPCVTRTCLCMRQMHLYTAGVRARTQLSACTARRCALASDSAHENAFPRAAVLSWSRYEHSCVRRSRQVSFGILLFEMAMGYSIGCAFPLGQRMSLPSGRVPPLCTLAYPGAPLPPC